MPHPNQPFDPRLGRLRRGRAARGGRDAFFLHRRAAEELLERLDLVARPFATALDVSAHPAARRRAARRAALRWPRPARRMLPAIGGPFDLVTSLGLLDTINDLPGALALIRRALRPDGLFLAAFAGAGSLPRLRRAMRAGEEAEGLRSLAAHPPADRRARGRRPARSAPASPCRWSTATWSRSVIASLGRLVADLRAMGATNSLARARAGPSPGSASPPRPPISGRRTVERFEIVYLSGWAPGARSAGAGAARQRHRLARRRAQAALIAPQLDQDQGEQHDRRERRQVRPAAPAQRLQQPEQQHRPAGRQQQQRGGPRATSQAKGAIRIKVS